MALRMTHLPLILILAAGAASRMRGGDKMLEQVAGVPQLRRIVTAACATGAPVRVALPPDRPLRAAALTGLDCEQVLVANASAGMSASIRAGTAGWTGAVMILPADMPDLDTPMLQRMLACHRQEPRALLRGSSGAEPGHPVLFPADLVPALRDLQGDVGARPVVQAARNRLRLVPLPDRAALTDLDTPEDWAAWRAARPEA